MYVIVGTVQEGNHRETWISPNSPFETLKDAIKAIEYDMKYEKSIGAQIHYWNCFTRDDATFTYTIRELGEAYVRELDQQEKKVTCSKTHLVDSDDDGHDRYVAPGDSGKATWDASTDQWSVTWENGAWGFYTNEELSESTDSKYTSPVKFSSTDNYGSGPDDEDDVYTVEEFVRHCRDMSFIDYDGHGYPVRDSMADRSYTVYPSEYSDIPKDATHIVWYNK